MALDEIERPHEFGCAPKFREWDMDNPKITWKHRKGRSPYAETDIRGKTYHLGTDPRTVKLKYAKAMAEAYADQPRTQVPAFVASLVELWLLDHPEASCPELAKTWATFAARIPLSAVTPDHMEGYVAWMKRGYVVKPTKHRHGSTPKRKAKSFAPSSIRRRVYAARKICQWAVDHGWMTAVPRLPKMPQHMLRPKDVDAERLQAAFDSLPSRAGALLRFILETGCRPSEARYLKWTDVHLDGRLASLSEHKTALRTGRPRLIVLSDQTVKLLSTLRRSANPLVFPSRLGRPYTQSGLRSILRRHARGITPYQLRHTFAQHASDMGVATDDLAKLLGHSDPSTTRFYAEIGADRLRRVAATLTSPLPDRPPGNPPATVDAQAVRREGAKALPGKSGKVRSRRTAG